MRNKAEIPWNHFIIDTCVLTRAFDADTHSNLLINLLYGYFKDGDVYIYSSPTLHEEQINQLSFRHATTSTSPMLEPIEYLIKNPKFLHPPTDRVSEYARRLVRDYSDLHLLALALFAHAAIITNDYRHLIPSRKELEIDNIFVRTPGDVLNHYCPREEKKHVNNGKHVGHNHPNTPFRQHPARIKP